MHVHEQPPCARDIHVTMNKCFQQYDMAPDMFLVNITHDRRNFIGDADKAKSLCMYVQLGFLCSDLPFSSNDRPFPTKKEQN